MVWYTRNIGLQSFMATVERATLTRVQEDDTTQVRGMMMSVMRLMRDDTVTQVKMRFMLTMRKTTHG